jgi:hypothetical protein
VIAGSRKGVALLLAFFTLVLGVAFYSNCHYPVMVLAGESSTGTWMSGVLLVVSASAALMLGMKKEKVVWFVIATFFLILALDERFMFHEKLKEYIIFSRSTPKPSKLLYELPVIVGAFAGIVIVFLLWKNMNGPGRLILLCATVLGISSVVMDIMATGVFWEECFKLLGELLVSCTLLKMAGEIR